MNKAIGVSIVAPPTIDPVLSVVTVHVTIVIFTIIHILHNDPVCVAFMIVLHVLVIHIYLKNRLT